MEDKQRKEIVQGSVRPSWTKMSSSSRRSMSASIEATASGEWRLLSDDGTPQVFSAEVLAGLLKEAKDEKTRITDMEKQLDEMSVQCDEKDRLMNEKKELLKGFGVSAGEIAMDEKERDAMSQLTGVVAPGRLLAINYYQNIT
jgi:hypothetical protein